MSFPERRYFMCVVIAPHCRSGERALLLLRVTTHERLSWCPPDLTYASFLLDDSALCHLTVINHSCRRIHRVLGVFQLNHWAWGLSWGAPAEKLQQQSGWIAEGWVWTNVRVRHVWTPLSRAFSHTLMGFLSWISHQFLPGSGEKESSLVLTAEGTIKPNECLRNSHCQTGSHVKWKSFLCSPGWVE